MKLHWKLLLGLSALAFAVMPLLLFAGEDALPSTAYSRDYLLRATSAGQARTNLGLVSTNATTVTNPWDQTINAAGFSLTNAGSVAATNVTAAGYLTVAGNQTNAGTLSASSFAGSATGLTNVPASSLMPLDDGPLILPTGDAYKTVTHPSLVINTNANAFGGYRYWLAFSGFPSASREWTRVAASRDMATWVSVADGNTNLFGSTDLAAVDMSGGWVADPNLFINTNGMMVLLSMAYKSGASSYITNKLLARTSTDGQSWSSVNVLNTGTPGTAVDIAGPTIVSSNNVLRLYYVNEQDYTSNALCYYAAADGSGTNWTFSENLCGLATVGASNAFPWHFDIKHANGKFYMLYSGQAGGVDEWSESTDGITWDTPIRPAMPERKDYPGGIYKPSLVPVPGDPLRWNILAGYYTPAITGGTEAFTNKWHILRFDNVKMPVGPRLTLWFTPWEGKDAASTATPAAATIYPTVAGHTTIYAYQAASGSTFKNIRYQFPTAKLQGYTNWQVSTCYILTNATFIPELVQIHGISDNGTDYTSTETGVGTYLGSGSSDQIVWAKSTASTISLTNGIAQLIIGTETPAVTNSVWIYGAKLDLW